MASFISQISEECNKCKRIIDYSVIKALRFENDLSATHQILGPLFKKPVPSPITDLMREKLPSALATRVRMVEVGCVESPRSLALDY